MTIPAYLGRGPILILILLAFGISFAGVLTLSSVNVPDSTNITVRFDNSEYSSPSLQSGWGKQRPWGVQMKDQIAVVALPGARKFSKEWQLIVVGKGETRFAAKAISVFVNEVALGSFELSPNGADTAQRLSVAGEVLNKHTPAVIKFQLDPSIPPTMTLRSISLHESSQLGNKTGHVEVCRTDRVAGYAAADGVQIVPEMRVEGKVVAANLRWVHRTDLREIGPYTNYGFEFRFATALAPKAKVRITFPDGTELRNSPCLAR